MTSSRSMPRSSSWGTSRRKVGRPRGVDRAQCATHPHPTPSFIALRSSPNQSHPHPQTPLQRRIQSTTMTHTHATHNRLPGRLPAGAVWRRARHGAPPGRADGRAGHSWRRIRGAGRAGAVGCVVVVVHVLVWRARARACVRSVRGCLGGGWRPLWLSQPPFAKLPTLSPHPRNKPSPPPRAQPCCTPASASPSTMRAWRTGSTGCTTTQASSGWTLSRWWVHLWHSDAACSCMTRPIVVLFDLRFSQVSACCPSAVPRPAQNKHRSALHWGWPLPLSFSTRPRPAATRPCWDWWGARPPAARWGWRRTC
jgi:hypothetical protein